MTIRRMEGALWEFEDGRQFRLVGSVFPIWVECDDRGWFYRTPRTGPQRWWLRTRQEAMRECVKDVDTALREAGLRK